MKKNIGKMLSVLMCLGLILLMCSCGGSSQDYSEYDGYRYMNPSDGHVKYYIDAGDGLKMHCFFMSGDPEYYEVVYDMDLDSAQTDGDTLIIKKVTDSEGTDISGYFKSLSFTFGEKEVLMKVQRDESTLAGGTEDNVLTGEYRFTPAQ